MGSVNDFYSLERAAASMDFVQHSWLLVGHNKQTLFKAGLGAASEGSDAWWWRSWNRPQKHPPSDVLGLLQESKDVSIAVRFCSKLRALFESVAEVPG